MSFDMKRCTVCPRECGADRTKGMGLCGADDFMQISKIMLHKWEEPCISGSDENRGSGAIFFSGCPLKCVFCQNKDISRGDPSAERYTPEMLAEAMRKLEKEGAYNINFVSPTQYTPQIIEALRIYRPRIPTVFNTGGYEKAETVEALTGYADIFLTDFKYGSNEVGKRFSACAEYVETAISALKMMLRVAGPLRFDDNGMMTGGVIVRHLILPSCRKDSISVLKRIADEVGAENVLLSLMSQYTPEFAPDDIKSLKRRITTFEYESVRDEAISLGFTGFSQDIGSANACYTPDFKSQR